MLTIAIDKDSLRKGDFVLLPKNEYQALVARARQPLVATPQKKRALPAWLSASLKDARHGNVSGPFATIEELEKHLEK